MSEEGLFFPFVNIFPQSVLKSRKLLQKFCPSVSPSFIPPKGEDFHFAETFSSCVYQFRPSSRVGNECFKSDPLALVS